MTNLGGGARTKRRPRVLMITSNYPRFEGDSTTPFVLHLAQDLVERGAEVTVLAPHAEGIARSEILGGVPVERFRYAIPDSAQTVCYQGGALVNLRKRPLEKLKLPALVLSELLHVQHMLWSGDYDLVHSHWILPQGFVGAIATLLEPLPHVLTVHGGDIFALNSPLLTRFKRLTVGAADAVTVNSSFTERRVFELGPSRERVHRIPMGVRTDEPSEGERTLAAKIRRVHRGAGPLLGFVGRVVEEKGVFDLIRAVAVLRAAGLDARALVVGTGPESGACATLVEELSLGDSVSLVGWVQPDAVRSHLMACDIFVGPSKTAPDGWVEAQGLTFLEAMIAGVPVIATNSGGIPDSVIHEKTGLLVSEGDPKAIADAVRRLHDFPELAKRLLAAARTHASSGFSRDRTATRFLELYGRLTSTASRRGAGMD